MCDQHIETASCNYSRFSWIGHELQKIVLAPTSSPPPPQMRELQLSQLEVLQRHQEELEARASAEATLLRLQHTEQLQQTMVSGGRGAVIW